MKTIALRAKNYANNKGIPDEWPVRFVSIEDDMEVPAGWELISYEKLLEEKRRLGAEYEVYQRAVRYPAMQLAEELMERKALLSEDIEKAIRRQKAKLPHDDVSQLQQMYAETADQENRMTARLTNPEPHVARG